MSSSFNPSSASRSVEKNTADDIVHSPCVGICALDDQDICIGCWRSGQEISQWGRLDADEKRQVLRNAVRRMA